MPWPPSAMRRPLVNATLASFVSIDHRRLRGMASDFHEVRFPLDMSPRQPRRAGAADRYRHARLRPRAAQRRWAAFAPPLRCRARRAARSSAARRHRLLRGAARPALRLPLARPRRRALLRALADADAARPAHRHRRRRDRGVPAGQDLRRGFAPYQRPSPSPSRAACASRSAASSRPAPAFTCDPTTGLVTLRAGHARRPAPRSPPGFAFDVPVRFDTDDLEVDLAAFAAGAIPQIPLIEIMP